MPVIPPSDSPAFWAMSSAGISLDSQSPIDLLDPATNRPVARCFQQSLLSPPPANLPSSTLPTILWSGSFAQLEPDSADPATTLFSPHPHTFTRPGYDALTTALSQLSSSLPQLILRTHAYHIISDIPSSARLLREFPNVQILIDPVSMLTESIVSRRDAHDHLRRIYQALADAVLPRPPFAVIVSNAQPHPLLELSHLYHPTSLLEPGLLDSAFIRDLARALPAGIPRLLVGHDAHAQTRFLTF